MNKGDSVSKREETVSAEPESAEPVGGELTEDELNEAVGGVGNERATSSDPRRRLRQRLVAQSERLG